MNFLSFLKALLIFYAFWYAVNILLDLAKGNKTSSIKGDKKTVDIINNVNPQEAGETSPSIEQLNHTTKPRRVTLDWEEDNTQTGDNTRYMPQPETAETEASEIFDEPNESEMEYGAANLETSLQADLGLENTGNEGYSLSQLETFNMEDFKNAA